MFLTAAAELATQGAEREAVVAPAGASGLNTYREPDVMHCRGIMDSPASWMHF